LRDGQTREKGQDSERSYYSAKVHFHLLSDFRKIELVEVPFQPEPRSTLKIVRSTQGTSPWRAETKNLMPATVKPEAGCCSSKAWGA
jgi:hypothetical protein